MTTFPFTAIVAQDEMRQALLIAAVDPSVGGVLVFGDRGTGKSTAIRALAGLLPRMRAVVGCPYACDPEAPAEACPHCSARSAASSEDLGRSSQRGSPLPGGEGQGEGRDLSGRRTPRTPALSPWEREPDAAGEELRRAPADRPSHLVPVPVVDLPLGATEDRVVGALDLQRALTLGEKAFEPGLLARANRGFLYIDEVNLLEDHLVDLLLDVAASGVNTVEREGLSVRHPARFVLVGSGNPEEGELRPQLLDRFGLAVEVTTPTDIAIRIDVVRRRDAYERDASGFCATYAKAEQAVAEQITLARERLPAVVVPDAVLEACAKLCLALGTDGLRGELTLMRTARALAALDGAAAVTIDHVRRIAPAALRHRLRRNPLDEAGSTARVARAVAEVLA